jgi:hypothetical protein
MLRHTEAAEVAPYEQLYTRLRDAALPKPTASTCTESAVGVRDSKQLGHGPVLEFTSAAWEAFVRATRDGQFDL